MKNLELNLEDIQIIVVQSINDKKDDVDYSEIFTRIPDTDLFTLKYVSDGMCEFCGDMLNYKNDNDEWVTDNCSKEYQQLEMLDILNNISNIYGDNEDIVIYINDEEIKGRKDIITLKIELEE